MDHPASEKIETVFILPISAKDVKRATYTARSIRKYCKRRRIYLLLDGCDQAALPPELGGQDVRTIFADPPTGGNWGKIWLNQCEAMVQASKEPDVAADAIFVKIDADALIIREGFSTRAQRIFATRPLAGQIGQTFSNIRGARFTNAGWSNYVSQMMSWRGLRQFILSSLRQKEGVWAALSAYRDFKNLVKGAVKNGYVFGDFCLGGCYIVRRDLVTGLSERVSRDKSPVRFLPLVGEDVVMTLHTYWLGFAPVDDSLDDGIFGIEGKEFRIDPFVLKGRGHYILHPLKYGHSKDGYNLAEEELVNALLNA